jgi:hypothetical protein
VKKKKHILRASLLTHKSPDDVVSAAKLIPWNDVRGEEDFRAKKAKKLLLSDARENPRASE